MKSKQSCTRYTSMREASMFYLYPGTVAYARNMSALSGSMFVVSVSSSSARVATGRPALHCATEKELHYIIKTGFIPQSSGFSRGGAPTPKVGVLTYFVGRKLHENERIWTPGGRGHASLAPPLDPPLQRFLTSVLVLQYYPPVKSCMSNSQSFHPQGVAK